MKKQFYLPMFITLFFIMGFSFSGYPTQAIPSIQEADKIHALYFYADDCSHCKTVEEEILKPLLSEYDDLLDIQYIEIGEPENYELLINAEEYFNVAPQDRQLPNLVIGEQILIGEENIRDNLPGIIEEGIAQGGIAWPALPGLNDFLNNDMSLGSPIFSSTGESEICTEEDTSSCESDNPIYAAYFYQTGCQECSRVEADIEYVRAKYYPQLIVEKFNINKYADMAQWLVDKTDVEDFHTPSIFVQDTFLIGEDQITAQTLRSLLSDFAENGAEKVWENYDAAEAQNAVVDNFKSLKPLTIVFAGLIDGLNPCAFATIIFFVSYLTLSGRKGKEILEVGAAFTLGVFLAYFFIGLGFYKILDLLGDLLTTLGRWVYGITALLCAGLAIFSFLDFLKARKGNIGDMSLNLPENLRKRINSVIRKGRNTQAYALGAFITGIIISFLELACTGQIYIPTIIFVSSIPELRGKATFFLFIYNFFFTIPLIIVFIMAYYGTTSKDLKDFFQRNAAKVKLGMTILFTVLAIWLGTSLII